ncbi:MAG TPA: nuclear transport factor 2 family protein [Rhizomicrobium sp.]|nr:nuclear transport factor 2 family protein [Rhizomicrobium sp.]
MRYWLGLLLLFLPAAALADDGALLKQKTQALMDAVTAGDVRVWPGLLDRRFTMIDENGVISNYDQSVAQVTPLPKGISGSILVTEWKVAFFGDTAVSTYLDDEHEDFHGQRLHALYRSTGTWLKDGGAWKLIEMQTLALRQDPPAVALASALTDSYVGRYRVGPDYEYVISKKDGRLYGATNGGKPVELKAELTDVLFTPGQPRTRKIFQRDAGGAINGFVSRREERDVVFTRER